MIARLRRMSDNLGPGWAIYNLVGLAVLGWIVLGSLRGPAGLLLAPIGLAAFLLPRLFLTPLIDNAQRVIRVLRVTQWIIIAAVLLSFAGVLSLPWWGWLLVMGGVVLFASANFWIVSDPRLYTDRAYIAMQEREVRALDRELRRTRPGPPGP